MISYNQLGKMGRLGNQMFQYAALKGIARNMNYDFCIPESHNPIMDSKFTDHQLFEAFDLNLVTKKYLNVPDLEEKQYEFDEYLFNNCPDNINLNGYFQSYKYFDAIKEEIKNDFTFKTNNFVDFDCSEFTSIHVRRGDYLQFSNSHPLCDLSYYYECMKIIGLENKFLIFSDDLNWCRQQDLFNKNCYFVETNNNINDLYLMTQCKNNIIANSSFSWWGAYLNNNNNKIVLAPARWFGTALQNNTKDLILEDWFIL